MQARGNVPTLIALPLVAGLVILSLGCGSQKPAPTAGEATLARDSASVKPSTGHDLFVSKGCAACHGQNAGGTTLAPALPGHNEEMVKRQVRNPRFQMPAFSRDQISDPDLDAIAGFIARLESDEHQHHEATNLPEAVEMHHWMALESLKVDDTAEAAHHVSHIIELLEPGGHQAQMRDILGLLEKGGDTHAPEHDIEGMLAGTASPDLTLMQLHLRQALISLAVGDAEEAKHHVVHAQELADEETVSSLAEVLQSLESNDLHDSEHGLQELLGRDEHQD
ncbi:MAG: hypothetical protein BZY88_04940 [SAR202 cluster bacterium Io17-Chloro-G9]|nr:MAG: hypothetical protein BZY88_04940 [SAR202 cluster bacterium Io17-Chloro-G9]